MLQIQKLDFAINDRILFSGLNWIIKPKKRIALIGSNGAGKTTLFNIIQDPKDLKHHIIKPKDYTIGYLPQEEIRLKNEIIMNTVMAGARKITEINEQMENIHHELDRLSDTEHSDKQRIMLEQLGELEHQFSELDGYILENNVKKILSGLGFQEKDFLKPVFDLSGGWRMRVYLARLLIEEPDLLLLDEPNNHLDIESLEWLEQYLLRFKGSIIIISHDRFFVNRLVQEIYELENGNLTYYPGDYQNFEKLKLQKYDLDLKKWQEQEKIREKQQKFIDRFRAKNTKARQVQSRISRLDKMEAIEKPVITDLTFDFKISVEKPSYKHVLHINDLQFGYEKENLIFDKIDLEIYRQEKIALVGVNGAGKTTLTKLITGQITLNSGKLELGTNTNIAYYAQHQVEALQLENTVFTEMQNSVSLKQMDKIQDVLAIFGFQNDDINKKIKVLSGGEKSRLTLAKILFSKANFIIMDEPTNHLDVYSRTALEKALSVYDGTLLIISHDRYFLDKFITRVIELKDRKISSFIGNYSEYINKQQITKDNGNNQNVNIHSAEKQQKPDQITTDKGRKSKEQKRQEAQIRQSISKDRAKLQSDIKELEETIKDLEEKKENIQNDMSNPETYENGEKISALQKDFARYEKELGQKYKKWEDKNIALDNLLTNRRE